MPITDDIRAYADTAREQGKQALDTAAAQLQEYTGKASQSVADARRTAEQAVNFDALSTAVEPYLAQLKEYTAAVTDRVDGLVATARSDKRVAAVVDRVEPTLGAVVGLANERIVGPVRSFAGLGRTPSQPVGRPGPKPTKSTATGTPRKRATTKPAAKPVTKPVNKPAARKTTAGPTAD